MPGLACLRVIEHEAHKEKPQAHVQQDVAKLHVRVFSVGHVSSPRLPSPPRGTFTPSRFFVGNWNQSGFLAEGRPTRTLREMLTRLRETYCSHIGYEVRVVGTSPN